MYKRVKKLIPTQAAYIAGIIDGEGTITLTRRHKNEHRLLAITISNTDRKLLEWILNAVGAGKITTRRLHNSKHVPDFTYGIYSQQALSLLNQIYPYLQTYNKQKRAKLILENYNKLTPRNGRYSKNLLEQREKFIKNFFAIKTKIEFHNLYIGN